MAYDSKQLAVVVPTKDRPQQIRELLESLAAQSRKPGRIIIVDGGESVDAVIDPFRIRLDVLRVPCHPPGQVRQRLKGLEAVDDSTPLVGFFDDDIVFEQDAVERMLDFWNRAPVETAGVAFNLTNISPQLPSKLRSLLGMSGKPGQILRSGFNISVANQTESIRTQWLPGGCTVWRLDVVRAFPQEPINTKWAAGEDVRFSYPIGKRHPLFVCADARVKDTGQTTALPAPERARFQGKKTALAYYYLVEKNPELSKAFCIWMIAAGSVLLGIKALVTGKRSVHRAIGQAESLGVILKAIVTGNSIKPALED